MSNKKVVYAKLHDGFFVPPTVGGQNGGGNFSDTLPPNKTLENFSMELEPSGALLLTWTSLGFKHSCLVGAANVKNAVFAPEKIMPSVASESKSA